MTDTEEFKKLKVAELKEKLSEVGLPVTGKKDELLARLIEYHDKQAETEIDADKKDDDDLLVPPPDDVPSWMKQAGILPPKIDGSSTTDQSTNESPKRAASPAKETAKAPASPMKKTDASTAATAGSKDTLVSASVASDAATTQSDNLQKPAAVVPIPGDMSEEEKKRLRALRFGTPLTTAKIVPPKSPAAAKQQAVKRPDDAVEVSGTSKPKDQQQQAKKQKTEVPAKPVLKVLSEEEKEKMRKRAERFGLPPPTFD